jgi:hypothetical protein
LFSVAGGMDFRAMLMRKKKPAKKVVVVSTTVSFFIFTSCGGEGRLNILFLCVMPQNKKGQFVVRKYA